MRRRKGLAVPERDLQKIDGRKIALGYGISIPRLGHEDALDEIFRTLSIGKTETRRREHSV